MSISDTDPSTYVIVPILMLPLLVLFSLKTDPEPKVKKKDIIFGVSAFVLFIFLTILMRIYLSFLFLSFRMDMLLFPLAIAAAVSLLFGSANIQKFKSAMLYSLLASPLVLLPIINASGAFVQSNTLMIYGMIKLLIGSAQYIAPITISVNGYSIGIGASCVSLGIFIAVVLFLLPIAYLYDGKGSRKIAWVASGAILLLVLNLIRMFAITFAWFSYGPNSTILLIHSFIGMLLFYLVIVLMVLISKFYGLKISSSGQKRKRKLVNANISGLAIFATIVLLALYFYLTLNYSTSLRISSTALSNRVAFNHNNVEISRPIADILSKNNFTSFFMASKNGSYAVYSLSNKTINATSPIVLMVTSAGWDLASLLGQNNTIIGWAWIFQHKRSKRPGS